jgi:hypothetical protein
MTTMASIGIQQQLSKDAELEEETTILLACAEL